ncbi:MAG: ATP-dependent RNA helicase DbpA [Bradymonadia bacterium]
MSTPDEPLPTGAFALLGLSAPLCRAVEVLGYAQPTPIQTESLPPIVAGRDVLAQARTGTGKTLALAVGLLMRLEPQRPQIQGVVVCPTRELAEQVGNAVRRLARFMPNVKLSTLCGGVALRSQVPSLTPPPHLVVGTPGRLLDHLGRGTLDFSHVRVLVLDEADRMLDMGFSEPIAQIVGHTPSTRQTLLFSATYPPTIQSLSRGLQRSPVEVTVEDAPRAADLEQVFFEVEGAPADRTEAVRGLLLQYRPESALVFCATREDTRTLADKLSSFGFPALALSGELEQREREEVLVRFSNGSATVLVATDVAARGLDIDALGAVIAYELPRDPDVHLHRIGRTGRAGRPGLALNLCGPRERVRAEAIAERHGHTLRWSTVAPTSARTVPPAPAPMKTLVIEAGRQDKLRAGDLLGALCGEVGLKGDDVGQIEVGASRTYVAVRRPRAAEALAGLKSGKVKGRTFRVWALP